MTPLFRCAASALALSALILGNGPQVSAAPTAAVVPAPSNTVPISATLTVDWKTVVGTTTPATFGADEEMGSSAALGSGNRAYAKNLADIGIKFFRIHNGSLTDDWSDASKHQWNISAIQAAHNAPYLRGATIIQNIPGPPSWLRNSDNTVKDVPAYAAYCAQLVTIVNTQLKKHVVYWEPMNEWEDRYKGKWSQACDIYNQCAIAMKKQDPAIKIGPAIEWPNQGGIIQPLLQHCAGNVDFIAYHSYYETGPTESTDSLMAKAGAMDQDVINTQKSIAQYGRGKTMLVMLDEYNMSGDYTGPETRHFTNIGAVYFATLIKRDAYAGAFACAIWSAKEGFYGITDMDDHMRLPAYLFQWANHNLIGSLAKTVSSHPMIEAMAVRQKGIPSIMVINKASGSATITLTANMKDMKERTVNYCTLTAAGMSAMQTMATSRLSSFVMQPCSLLFLSAARDSRPAVHTKSPIKSLSSTIRPG